MPSVPEVTRRYVAAIRAREASALRTILTDWDRVIADLTERSTKLGDLIEAAGGRKLADPNLLFRQERIDALLKQAQDYAAALNAKHAPLITLQSERLALLGAQMGADQLVGMGFGTRLSTAAVEHIASAVAIPDVAQILARIPVGDVLAQSLITGIARGANPRAIAREVTRGLDRAVKRQVLTIARTEMARAQRSATLDTYEAHGMTGWKWVSARSPRTCAACWAKDGQVYDTAERVQDHPNGRCHMVPAEAELSSLGSKMARWERLSESDKMRILGPTRYKAYTGGRIAPVDGDPLRALATETLSPTWGRSIRVTAVSKLPLVS